MTRLVNIAGVTLGGDAPVRVQSMLNTDTRDVAASVAQAQALVDAGCELVRAAVPHADALDGFERLVAQCPVPVIADIHFDYRLALEAMRRGAAKLRINPGNIGDFARVDAIIDAAGEAGIPIRIGVNAGSLSDTVAGRSDLSLAQKLVTSAEEYVHHFESRGFYNSVLSVKASSVPVTIEAYRLLWEATEYPLHLGVTEAGTVTSGTIKSAVGLGTLLADGIGDTIRVSLTADPAEEVAVAWEILAALDLRRRMPELVSCPTCGRCRIDLVPLAQEVEHRLKDLASANPDRYAGLKVAVMGCEVNGPGEAREADFGIAAGKGCGLVFACGVALVKVPEQELVDTLFSYITA